jgi:hypothetical protein
MAIGYPILSGVWPQPNEKDVILRPTVRITFRSSGLIDPRSFGDHSFAVYGPGDVVLDSGPGTILNSGLEDAPYPLLDGPLRRDRVPGVLALHTSGNPVASGVDPTLIGTNATIYALWTPSVPLNRNTEYSVVLVGDDSLEWSTSDLTFPGVTTWTSNQTFSGLQPCSGVVQVVQSYNRITQTSLYNSTTNYNDTFTITITSGTGSNGDCKFTWNKASSPGDYPAVNISGQTHNFGDGLICRLEGFFQVNEAYSIDTYIPQPLVSTYVWRFVTGELNFTEPPTEPAVPSLVIDYTDTGIGISTTTTTEPLRLVRALPYEHAYGVQPNIGRIQLEFNKPLMPGSITASDINIAAGPLLNLPNIGSASNITPSGIEISGVYLNIYL